MHTCKNTQVTRRAGDMGGGFTATRVTPLPSIRSIACELVHADTGARLLSLQNSDSENLFCIAFKTLPEDNTGLAHVLEHAVLCGSRKYPLKNPFMEMAKGSMATFMNAMTYSDATVYPVASNVHRDLLNLMDVYWDAVFHPLLSKQTFQQEGHRLEFKNRGDRASGLIHQGIVYNEMKGAFSSPGNLLFQYSRQALFPDTIYGKIAAGDPWAIPDLTHERLKDYHQKVYRPGHSYLFHCGNMPLEELLDFLVPRLGHFGVSVRTPFVPVPKQPRYAEPRTCYATYPIGRTDDRRNRTFLNLSWIVADVRDVQEVLIWGVLQQLLLGTDAAPLRKALVDSKLGTDLSLSGFNGAGLEGVFRVSLKGSEPEHREGFEKLVLKVLKVHANRPFPRVRVEAAIRRLRYEYLEMSGDFPLRTCLTAYATWIHDSDPVAYLKMDETLGELEAAYERDPMIFSRSIRIKLIENTHRVSLVVSPDPDWHDKKEKAMRHRLKKIRSRMTEEDLANLERESEVLARAQTEADPVPLLQRLPKLEASDLPRAPRQIDTEVELVSGSVPVLRNDVFTNGVNYLHLNFNLEGLPSDLYPYLPLYDACFQKMGAGGRDFAQVSEREAAYTTGIGFRTHCSTRLNDASALVRGGIFSFKALDAQMEGALDVFEDKLFDLDFNNEDRFRDVLIQEFSAHQNQLSQVGNVLASRHAARGMNAVAHLEELLVGVQQVRLIEKLADGFERHRDEVIAKMEAIRDLLPQRNRLTVSFTGSPRAYQQVVGRIEKWAKRMRYSSRGKNNIPFRRWREPPREGLIAPTQLAYCVRMLPAPHLSDPDAAPLTVASTLLSQSYMWDEVRVKGGAYGAGTGWNGLARTWSFWSFHDPHIQQTLDAYRGLHGYVKRAPWTKEDVTRAIIATAKHAERPVRPGPATGAALQRFVLNDSPAKRQERYEAILKVQSEDIQRAVLKVLDEHFDQGAICIVSSRDRLEAANRKMRGGKLKIEKILR